MNIILDNIDEKALIRSPDTSNHFLGLLVSQMKEMNLNEPDARLVMDEFIGLTKTAGIFDAYNQMRMFLCQKTS